MFDWQLTSDIYVLNSNHNSHQLADILFMDISIPVRKVHVDRILATGDTKNRIKVVMYVFEKQYKTSSYLINAIWQKHVKKLF